MMQPVLFISHDDPNQVVNPDHPSHQFLSQLSQSGRLAQPKAVLCISGHWETLLPTITGANTLKTIHDFYGFPPEFYRLNYDVAGDPQLAKQIKALFSNKGIAAEINDSRGIDHGAWCVLKPLFPDANIPVLQLSINPLQSALAHFELGQILKPLREQGVLIIGSGTMTHNLSEWRKTSTYSMPIEAYAKAFRDWVCEQLRNKDYAKLCQYLHEAPHAKRSHPTPDHILPLFVAAGASSEQDQWQILDDSYIYGCFSMASFMWSAPTSTFSKTVDR
jgi:4,5-DOPA dioxygenase extradiol